eukprot:SAG31_NODE_2506_length_5591_cov_4.701384_3_plen_143_part_00
MKAKALTTIAAVTDNSARDIPRLLLQSKLFDTGSDFTIGMHACSMWSAFCAFALDRALETCLCECNVVRIFCKAATCSGRRARRHVLSGKGHSRSASERLGHESGRLVQRGKTSARSAAHCTEAFSARCFAADVPTTSIPCT